MPCLSGDEPMKAFKVILQVAALIFGPVLGWVILDANQRQSVLSFFDTPFAFSALLFSSVAAVISSFYLGIWKERRRGSTGIIPSIKERMPTLVSDHPNELSSTVENLGNNKRRLRALTKNEKNLLNQEFIEPDRKSAILSNEDRSVRSLSRSSVIYILDTFSIDNSEAEYGISDWAWELLKLNKSMLESDSQMEKPSIARPFKRNSHLDGLDNF